VLKSWRVARFKSIRSETRLSLAPLTLFAGANSAGKSSILQSILLTAQTLQSALNTRAVVLNGHILRLGAFSDVVSLSAANQDILIGFELDADEDLERQRAYRVAGRRRFLRPMYRRGLERAVQVDCSFAFSARGPEDQRELLQLQPELEHVTVRATSSEEGARSVEEIRFRRAQSRPEERADALKVADDARTKSLVETLRWEVEERRGPLPPYPGARSGKEAGVAVNHFLPEALSVVFDAVAEEVQEIVDALTASERRCVDPGRLQNVELPAKAQEIVWEAVREVIEEFDKAPQEQLFPVRSSDAYRWVERIRSGSPNELLRNLGRLQRDVPAPLQLAVANKLASKRDALRDAVQAGRVARMEMRYVPLPESVAFGVEALQHYFSTAVRYLGPLRDEPKPIYPLSATSDSRDVGFRGEHTAAVLDAHRNTEVSFVRAPDGVQELAKNAVPVSGRLIDAVLEWLRYMGVGSDVRTSDRGKLGHEMRVATAGSERLHDLTHVGVGVSQVLPILVLALLADRGATLIFEQPELHLHPRVQTRLADFFVAMTQLGKQCIVETHSEYLINRLRYRSAIAEGGEIAEAVVMYFVEKREGESVYREVRINEFGVIEKWPEGFFDENEELASEILRAGMRKRRGMARGADA